MIDITSETQLESAKAQERAMSVKKKLRGNLNATSKIVRPPIVVGQLSLISVNGLENCNNAEVFLAADIFPTFAGKL